MFNLYNISGNIFKELEYIDCDDILIKLTKILQEYLYSYEYINLILKMLSFLYAGYGII